MNENSTDTLTTPTGPAVKKKGLGRKFAVVGILGAAILVGFTLGKGGDSTASAAPDPVKVTVTAPAPAPKTVTVTESASAPVTVTADAPAPVTVEVPAQAPAPVTITEQPADPAVPAAPQSSADPAGAKKNGKYLIGSQIDSGTWQCSEAETIGDTDIASWTVSSQSNEIVDIELDTIAIVPADGYTVDFSGCVTSWVKV